MNHTHPVTEQANTLADKSTVLIHQIHMENLTPPCAHSDVAVAAERVTLDQTDGQEQVAMEEMEEGAGTIKLDELNMEDIEALIELERGDLEALVALKSKVEMLQGEISVNIEEIQEDVEPADEEPATTMNESMNEETALLLLAEMKEAHEQGQVKLDVLENIRSKMQTRQDQAHALDNATEDLATMQNLLYLLKGIPSEPAESEETTLQNDPTNIQSIHLAIESIQNQQLAEDDAEMQSIRTEAIEKLQRLAQQEQEINHLRTQIEELETVRSNLANQRHHFLVENPSNESLPESDQETSQLMERFTNIEKGLEALEDRQKMLSLLTGDEESAAEPSVETREPDSSSMELMTLMQRLTAASLPQTEGTPIEESPSKTSVDPGATIEELEQECEQTIPFEENTEEIEKFDFNVALESTEPTLAKVDFSIKRVVGNLEELNNWVPTNEKDKEDVAILKNSLQNQLLELHQVRNQILYYQKLLLSNEQLVKQQAINQDTKTKKRTVRFADALEEFEQAPKPVEETPQDTTTWKAKTEQTPLLNHYAWIEKHDAQFNKKMNESQMEQGEIVANVPIQAEQSANMKELFDRVKDRLYKGAASAISCHENEPYFLLQMFKGLTKMNSHYMRQKLLILMDEIIEEEQKPQEIQ